MKFNVFDLVYLVPFFIGLIYSVVSIVGELFDIGDTPDIGDALDVDDLSGFDMPESEIDLSIEPIGINYPWLALKPATVSVFMVVFGGTGIILQNLLFLPFLLELPVAFILGVLMARVFYRFIYIPLLKAQTQATSITEGEGTKAFVQETIQPSGFGKISFTLKGNIYNAPACEYNVGQGIKKGRKVIIVQIKNNIYYVVEAEANLPKIL